MLAELNTLGNRLSNACPTSFAYVDARPVLRIP